MHFLYLLTGRRIEDFFQAASQKAFVDKRLYRLTFLIGKTMKNMIGILENYDLLRITL